MSISFFKKFFDYADPAGLRIAKDTGFYRLIYSGGDL